jgi:alpha/beta superfamily hydrolase
MHASGMLTKGLMAPVDALPPPPEVPVRSPAVAVQGEVEATVPGLSGGPALEARIHVPPSAARTVVLCHPHPLYGGSMHSPVPLVIAKLLAEKARERVAWARFNFRGVGSSVGRYDHGRGEVDDARAILDYLRAAAGKAPVTLCGHSFGSSVALRAAAADGRVERVLLISPSARLFDSSDAGRGPSAKVTIFIGDRDEICDVDDARALARQFGAEIRVFEGQDHHFLKSRRALAEAALAIIAPEVIDP